MQAVTTIAIENVLLGMELGKPLIAPDGRVILCEGTILTASLLRHLRQWGIEKVAVRQKAVPVLRPARHSLNEREEFVKVYRSAVKAVHQAFEAARIYAELPMQDICQVAERFLVSMVKSRRVIHYLYTLQEVDEYTFNHSVNVGILSGVIGRWLGYSEQAVHELILAGLLHDIGKTQVPIFILMKPAKLSQEEMEIMKLHTCLGYELMHHSAYAVPPQVNYGVLQHHERMDGSGYPQRLKSAEIHEFARIIAIADIYDAMTSNRVYSRKRTPFDVVKTLKDDMFDRVDPQICAVFLQNVCDYFIGSQVELSDGRQGEIVAMLRQFSDRPVIRTPEGVFIDLERERQLSIVSFDYLS